MAFVSFASLAAFVILNVGISTAKRRLPDGSSGFNNPYLDGPFLIRTNISGTCLSGKGNKVEAVTCKRSDVNQKWQWMNARPLALRNKGNRLCLTLAGSKVLLKKCEKTKHQLWKCKWRKKPWVLESRSQKLCLRVKKTLEVGVLDCKKNDSGHDFFLYGTRDTIICTRQTKMGRRTRNPNYYLFKNELFRLNWPVKYAKIFLVYNKDMFDRFVKQYRRASTAHKKIKDHAIEAFTILDKAYRQINVRMLLVGYEVWDKGDKINKSTVYKTLRKEFQTYVFETLNKKYKFDSAVFIYGQKWDGRFGGIAINDMCEKGNKRKDEVFVMVMRRDTSPKGLANILSHEFGHQFDTGHEGEHTNPCPNHRLYGTYCTMSGNGWPKGFSAKLLKNIRTRKYTCLNKKPHQNNIFGCGNGQLDVGEECDCGKSEKCQKRHPCCDGRICKLKKGAQCSTGHCCTNCKFDENKRGCSGPTITMSTNKKSYILEPTYYFNVRQNWKIVAPRGQRIELKIVSMNMEFQDECPYDYIEIRDGASKRSKLIGKYCRKPVNPIIRSTSNLFFISYRSDQSFPSYFYLTFKSIENRRG